jgi:hypothetical protein
MLDLLWSALDSVKYLFGRPSLRVRVFEENETQVGGLKIEIENVGSRPTSLMPHIHIAYWVPEGPRIIHHKAVYDVREVDRELPPFKARVFTATGRGVHHNYGFSWFRSYLVRTTTGHWTRAHTRHALLDPLSVWRYWWELALFRTRGRINAGAARMSITRMGEDRRARGPH